MSPRGKDIAVSASTVSADASTGRQDSRRWWALVAVSLAASGGGKLLAGAVALAAAACATVAFGAVAFLLDRGDLRAMARRVRRVAGRRRTR